jgi:prephenate dehydrogenase
MADRPAAAVLGLGILGASLALALRRSGRYGAVVAWDPDFDVAREAQRANVADRYARSAPDAVQRAAAVFVAAGAAHLREVLAAAGPHLSVGAVVCSVDDAHEEAAAVARETLPANVSFISVNPVLWEEIGPETTPSAALFAKGVLSLTPTETAHPDAVAYVVDLAGALEMEPYFVDAREHDAFFTGIGRLPAVVAAAMLRLASRQPAWRELSRVAGGQFRHATEAVAVEPARQQEALAAGREHLVRWLDSLVEELSGLRDALADGREPPDFFASAAETRLKWLQDRQTPASAAELPALPTDAAPKRRFWR